MRTFIGNDRCTRCGGGSSPCPVCNPVEEEAPKRKVFKLPTKEELEPWLPYLTRLDAERTDRLYREALIREYGEVPSPVLLSYVGKQLCLPDHTRQLTMFGRVIATVPPLFPLRQYGEPCFVS